MVINVTKFFEKWEEFAQNDSMVNLFSTIYEI